MTPEMKQVYEKAKQLTGTLDEELKLARTKLDFYTEKWTSDPKGGVRVATNDGYRFVPWAELIERATDLVRKLEATRSAVQGADPSGVSAVERLMDKLDKLEEADSTEGEYDDGV